MKLTFSHGARLDDPHELFNKGFGGEVWRAIDLGREDPYRCGGAAGAGARRHR